MQGKMQSFTVCSALVFYATILGQTPLIETASVDWSETNTTDSAVMNDSPDDDAKDTGTTNYVYYLAVTNSTESTPIRYYGDPWSGATNATTAKEESTYVRDKRNTTTSSENNRGVDKRQGSNGTSNISNGTMKGGSSSAQAYNQSSESDATSTVSVLDFTNPIYLNETWNKPPRNRTAIEIREVTLYVLPNGTMIYGFPNGTSVNSSSTAITFPNGTVITSFPNGTSVNTTTIKYPNGTTSFTFPNGTTLNSSEIFSLPNATRISYVEKVSMSDSSGTNDGEEGLEGMTSSTTRRSITRKPRKPTTTTTSRPSSNGDGGGRRPIRRKGSIPQPAPRQQIQEDETTESSGNRRQAGNWFG